MNKFTKWFVVPMLCLAANFASAANIKDYPTVAVMEFGNKAITSRGLRGHDMAMATEYAIYQLSNCGWFDLIDYEQLSTIAKMHAINMSGMVDQGTAVQMGKVLGAQFMVIGNVTGLTTKENVAGVKAHNAKVGNAQHVVNANVAVRIVDIETGRIVAAGIGKGSSTSTMTEIGFTKYRNRKVETENIYNSVANHVVDEYSKNKIESSYDNKSYTNQDNRLTDTQKENRSHYVSEKEVIDEQSTKSNEYEDNYKKSYLETNQGNSSETSSNVKDNYSIAADKTNVKFVSIEGDVNEDGQIEEIDYSHLEEYIAYGRLSYKYGTKFSKKNADVNMDGTINIRDLWELRKIIYGIYPATYKHIVGDVDSANPYGEVTLSDVNRLKNYLEGDRNTYINILEADMNEDGYVTYDDLEILKTYVGTWQKKMIGNFYQTIPRKYVEYNQTHGIIVTKETGGVEKTGSEINTGNKKTSYEDEKNISQNEKTSGKAKETNNYDKIKNYSYKSIEDGKKQRTIVENNSSDTGNFASSAYTNENINVANNADTFMSSNKNIYYEREAEEYSIVIGTAVVSDVQVRNAISKAVRDAIYGKTGLMTTLNNGKQLKIKTGF